MAILRVPVELNWSGPGSPGVNVWHVRDVDESSPIDISDQITMIRNFYLDCLPFLAPNMTLTLGDVTNIETQELEPQDWDPITTATSGAAAPPVLQICVSWRTTLAARRGMGRTFLGPLADSVVDVDGTPVNGTIATVQSAANSLVAASTASANGAIAIYGYQTGVPAGGTRNPADPRVARDVTQARVRDVFAVLRSRRD